MVNLAGIKVALGQVGLDARQIEGANQITAQDTLSRAERSELVGLYHSAVRLLRTMKREKTETVEFYPWLSQLSPGVSLTIDDVSTLARIARELFHGYQLQDSSDLHSHVAWLNGLSKDNITFKDYDLIRGDQHRFVLGSKNGDVENSLILKVIRDSNYTWRCKISICVDGKHTEYINLPEAISKEELYKLLLANWQQKFEPYTQSQKEGAENAKNTLEPSSYRSIHCRNPYTINEGRIQKHADAFKPLAQALGLDYEPLKMPAPTSGPVLSSIKI